eukprot:TRINITY_DN20518_c0_g1_i1.p1 TRINITY_DN20518_c0_g1~~TRINITY_DN20518_c0_g1_i1.p1  ORF type:complete len:434 (+),score=57.46 TRINITY_DN20518_c0_g1_i1:159-1460(+)
MSTLASMLLRSEAKVEGELPGSTSSLATLLLSSEAFAVFAYLSPFEVAALTGITRWCSSSEQRMALWYSYYVLRWGNEYGVGSSTQICFIRSWLDDAWPAPWLLSVGFCGACTAWDHLFWFLPFIRWTLHAEKPRHVALPPPPRSVAWQAATRARAQCQGGDSRLRRCFVCDVLEVLPLGPEPQHFRKRWVRPCAGCVRRFAHRSCLEQALLADQQGALPSCSFCSREYVVSRRFAESLPELLHATMQEWFWVLRRLFVMFLFFAWLYSLADHYWSVSNELCISLAVTAAMMSISVSRRFHRGVQIIWNTPQRWRYFQIFRCFGLLFYTVSLRAFQPSQWEAVGMEQPWLAGLHRIHSMMHSSYLAASVLSSLSLLYVAASSGVIFLFWKTSLRVPTVADAIPASEDVAVQQHVLGSECGLCQLGLCLDNTCM